MAMDKSFLGCTGYAYYKALWYYIFSVPHTYGGPNGMGYIAYVISRIPNCLIFSALVLVLLPIVQKVLVERIMK